MSLQTGAQALNQEVPDRVAFPASHYVSTSDASLNRRHIEIPPLSDIAYDGNRTDFVFQVASATSFLDLQNSYIRGELTVTSTNIASSNYLLLEQGGIHSLFRWVEVSAAATGVVIDRLPLYNVFQCLESEVIHSGEYIDSMCADELDSSCSFGDKKATAAGSFTEAFLSTEVTDTAVTVDGVLKSAQPGDLLYIRDNTTDVVQLREVLSNNGVSVTTVAGTNPPNAGTLVLIRRGGRRSARHFGPDDVTAKKVKFVMRPRMGFWRQKKLFPLFLMAGGLRFSFSIDPSYASNSFFAAVANSMQTVSISMDKLRFNAAMLDMHSSINQQYVDLYAGRGLLIPFVSVENQEKQIAAGSASNISVDFHVGHRSARWALARLTGTDVFSSSATIAKGFPVLSMSPAMGLAEWGYESGSLMFPQKKVELDSFEDYPSELVRHLNITFRKIYDSYGDNSADMPGLGNSAGRHSYQDMVKRVIPGTGAVDFPKILLAAVLGRDQAGKFAGLDLSIQPLRLSLKFDSAMNSALGTQRLVQMFVGYDRYLHISKATGASVLT